MPPRGARLVVAFIVGWSLVGVIPLDGLARGGSKSKGVTWARDSRGKITRDRHAVSEVKRTHPTPPGCGKGAVDHLTALRTSGRDDASNRQ